MASPDPTRRGEADFEFRVVADAPSPFVRFPFLSRNGADDRHAFALDLTWLAGPSSEAWLTGSTGSAFRAPGGLSGVRDDELLFIELRADGGADALESAQALYERLFDYIRSQGFAHIVKAWNHLPRINEGAGDDENYKRFCLGRARAIDAHYADRPMPAGTGVGFEGGGGLQVHALATRHAPLYLENPRQVSAFEYPRQYGPRSPSFSRAVVLESRRPQLFVSGTAAIVGHQSRHTDCLESQIEETLRNWDSLFSACEAATRRRPSFDHEGAFRVYLRHADQLQRCLDALKGHGVPLERTTILRADICRPELLFELDGVVALDP